MLDQIDKKEDVAWEKEDVDACVIYILPYIILVRCWRQLAKPTSEFWRDYIQFFFMKMNPLEIYYHG